MTPSENALRSFAGSVRRFLSSSECSCSPSSMVHCAPLYPTYPHLSTQKGACFQRSPNCRENQEEACPVEQQFHSSHTSVTVSTRRLPPVTALADSRPRSARPAVWRGRRGRRSTLVALPSRS